MNLEPLLAPLADGAGCGHDMLFSDAFDRIAQMRRFDDPSLSQGEWVTDLKEADWPGVVKTCTSLLTDQTKDLRLAVWMTEALSNTAGFAGLADGYTLTAGLIEQHWEGVHPLPEDGDQEQRIGVLEWLLSQSERLVNQVPVTRSPRGSYSLADLASAQALTQAMERSPGEADSLRAQARVTQEAFDAARRDTAGAFFAQQAGAARDAMAALQALERAVDARLGMDGPAFGAAREALDAAIGLLGRFAREAGVHADLGEPACEPASVDGRIEPADLSAPGGAVPQPGPQASGPIQHRAQAIAQLKAVAEFFRRTEPHSPVAYLADKAAHWGEMSLHEWLRTVVKDDGALAHVEELLGVQAAATGDEYH
jgi:type VI secretion system protein ImpA